MSLTPLLERSLTFRGSPLASWLLARMGWRVEFTGLPARQGVIAVYPHTSNVDFPIGILAKWTMGMPANFWGKASLFRIPLFGRWLRWVGGIPVDRKAPGGLVLQTAEHLRRCRERGDYAWLVVAPEGTRKLTAGWRSGFYRVAMEADVPLGLATIDFGRRVVRVSHFVRLSGDQSRDMAGIEALLEQPRGYHPGNASPVRLT